MSTASRPLEALSLLRAHPGISAPSLAARLGVTERTAYPDLAQLRELGYPIGASRTCPAAWSRCPWCRRPRSGASAPR
ncbi:HTH domain-containing protein [Saccharopolyspora spinosa]|uniref:HTH domain-containing protein n=1 Tax=Saccharopolyspora spinosa TaxID=60894 RepID=UPI000A01F695|nr:helix-turn-helix domain-containing protein [Saccharopolyspora spinosa]